MLVSIELLRNCCAFITTTWLPPIGGNSPAVELAKERDEASNRGSLLAICPERAPPASSESDS
jgi:hypothetical protein